MKQKILFTSDHHFGHANIIRYSNRPFQNVEEMNEELIKRWNQKVGAQDLVYHLGDISLGNPALTKTVFDKLNGKIFLIKGNHENAALAYPKRFEWIKDYFELNVEDPEAQNSRQKIILFHYAMRTWRSVSRGTWHLYGHSHGNLKEDEFAQCFDVGVDCHDFYPLTYEEIKAKIKSKNWIPPVYDRDIK
ncbi:MAG TPA: metallophosphoesterase [Flavobacterium sp.]|jgi:calcineurin-like phosphoesterase family protein